MSDISNSNLTLTLKVSDVNRLLTILGETAYTKSADLISQIQAQGNPQVKELLAACEATPVDGDIITTADASTTAAPVEAAPAETPAA